MKKKLYIIKTPDKWYIGRTKNFAKKFKKILKRESQDNIEMIYWSDKIDKQMFDKLLINIRDFTIGENIYSYRAFGLPYSIKDVLDEFGIKI